MWLHEVFVQSKKSETPIQYLLKLLFCTINNGEININYCSNCLHCLLSKMKLYNHLKPYKG